MKDFFINIIKLLLSILIVLFLEEYFFKILALVGIHLVKNNIVILIIYLIELFLIYLIYGSEIGSAFSKYQNKLGSNFLYTIIAFIVLFISMMITNYIVKAVAQSMQISYRGLSFVNIFNSKFDFDLIVIFVKNIIVIPFVKVSIFVLGINNLIKGKSGIFFSGLIYALYEAFLIGGNFGNVFISVIPDFVLFIILSYVYRKNGNIAFSIMTYILYLLFAGLLVTKFM